MEFPSASLVMIVDPSVVAFAANGDGVLVSLLVVGEEVDNDEGDAVTSGATALDSELLLLLLLSSSLRMTVGNSIKMTARTRKQAAKLNKI